MKDIKKEIADLKARIQELENQIVEPVKWQPVGGNWYIDGGGDIYKSFVGSTEKLRQFGTERPTEQQAERAAVEMRRFNRLLALRDELCGDDVLMSWFSPDDRKYFIYFSHGQDRWNCSSDGTNESITPYYTTLKLAQKACDMLNSGEVEL